MAARSSNALPARPGALRSRSRRARAPVRAGFAESRFVRPNLGPLHIDRTRLAEALARNSDRPLCLLVAEAGYGKTSLAAAASQRLRQPVIWYSLSGADADPFAFARALLAAFRLEEPRFGADLERTLEDTRPGPRAGEILGGVLANAFGRLRGPVRLLVLDDFHEVAHDPGIASMLEVVLRHPPERLRVWITSRTAPPLALDGLRARGHAFEIDSSQLAFTGEEIERLFRDVLGRSLDVAEIEAVETATRGWPTAIHLIQEFLERTPGATLADALTTLHDSPYELHAFLSAEVFARLQPDARTLLERTSALERFDVTLAQRLSGLDHARTLLAALSRRGLVRSFGTGARTSYECHDLVRTFLQRSIEERDGAAAWRALEHETACALKDRGEAELALRAFLRATAFDDAVTEVEELAPSLLRAGRAAALLELVSALPPERVAAEAGLAIVRGDAHQALGHWNEAESDYEGGLAFARGVGNRALECHALLGLGKVWNLRGRHEQVLGMAERGLAVARELPTETRVRLLQMKAAAHFYLGQFHAAVEILDQVRSLLAGTPHAELLVQTVHNLAIAFASQGRYREASVEFRAALAHVRGASSPRAPLYLSNLATLLLEIGELAEARQAAEEGLAAAQRFSNRMQETMCHETLAEVLARTGDPEGALGELKRAEELNADLRMEVLTADLLAVRGRIFCSRGQYRRAVEFMTRALESLSGRPDAPRLQSFQSQLAWCELRAGRPHEARELLLRAQPAVDQGENDDQRMRVHYWLGEALLALGEAPRAAARHLATALELVKKRGYEHFLRAQAREEPAPLLFAMQRGIEVGLCAGALVEAGPAIEEPLLALLPGAAVEIGEAALAVLGEIGGAASRAGLKELVGPRRALKPAAATALKHIDERLRRGGSATSAPAPGRGNAPAAVRLVLFGPPRVEVQGKALPASAWRTQRAFHVLLFLALQPRGASRDALLEAFWPGRQAAAGRRNFHPTLSYLRRVLPRAGAPPLERDGETYRLHPDYGWTCDLWEFDSMLERTRRTVAPAARRQALEGALALAGRPLLEGLYGAWVDEVQGRVRDRAESAWIELGGLLHAAHEPERALAAFRRASELDEFRESTRVSVVECLVHTGNRRAAVVEAERLRSLLRRELGVDPLPETELALERALGASERPRKRPKGGSNGARQSIAPVLVAGTAQAGLKSLGGD
jgi:ATP/maltotriose-dependent transcriptional regulator MalT/DNA-binding SARP family transcriptional activator